MGFLHEHIILPISDLLKGEQVHRYLRFLRQAEAWDEEKMQAFQEQRFRELICYAAREVPYYREWFQTNGHNPEAITLNQLPVINKALMRSEGINRFVARSFPESKRMLNRSGGSTGEPFSFYVSKQAYSLNTAAKLRTWYQAGYRLGDPYMKIVNDVRTSKIKAIQDRFSNCVYLPFYSITEETLSTILGQIEKTKPLFIRSYPAPLFLLAKYRNTHLGYVHRPCRIFTTGSTLSQTWRDEIESAFGCDIIDSFSCEGTPNTYETTEHDGYHVTEAYGIIEVLDEEGRPVTDGIGRVVSTDLWNWAHAFIRYDTQDLVEVSQGKIKRIMGRESETLLETGGKLLTVHNFTHYFADHFSSVDGWQVVKRKDGSVEFRLVVNDQYSSSDEQRIIEHWTPRMGAMVTVSIVEALPLMANNKHLSIIQEA